jgi:tRNA (cytidine32/uridine32-2'-O)-methyltransferase
MANFGHSDLVVLNPFEPIWQEPRSAPEAEAVVRTARAVASWEEAVQDCGLVLGTSSFHQRPIEQAVVELPMLQRYLSPFPATTPVAFVFGSERSGLSNEELARCQAIFHIPTVRGTPSMNLAQAVAVTLYELRRGSWEAPAPAAPTPSEEWDSFIATLASMGEKLDYPPGYTGAARVGRIRHALQHAVLPASSVRFLLSFLRWVDKKKKETS